MIFNKQLFNDKLKVPLNIDVETILEDLGFIYFYDAGFPAYTPIGNKFKSCFENKIRDLVSEQNIYEVNLPSFHSKNLVKVSGKLELYSPEFFQNEFFVHSATNEEYILIMAKQGGLKSYKQLPIEVCDFGSTVRMIKRPKRFTHLREFSGCAITSLNESDSSFDNSLRNFTEISISLFDYFGIPYTLSEKNGGVDFIYTDSKGVDLSLSMGYKSNLSDAFGVNFATESNVLRNVVLGTFGIGLERLLYATIDSSISKTGSLIPNSVDFFETAIIPIDSRNSDQLKLSFNSYKQLNNSYIDTRDNLTLKQKLDLADFFSVKHKLLIGPKEVKNGTF